MKVAAVFVNPVLFAFSFSLAMGHTAFTTLADRAVHVLGQFQHFNQICKLLHGSFQGYSTPNLLAGSTFSGRTNDPFSMGRNVVILGFPGVWEESAGERWPLLLSRTP